MMKIDNNNPLVAMNQLRSASFNVDILGELKLQDPLENWLTVSAWDYITDTTVTKSALALCFAYTKWAVFYSIHEVRKVLEGSFMFKEQPSTMRISYIPFLRSYCLNVEVGKDRVSYLIASTEKAEEFDYLWNTVLQELLDRKLGSIYFDGEQAKINYLEDEYVIRYIDSDGKDTVISVKGLDKVITLKDLCNGINPKNVIRLERKPNE